MSDNIVVSGVPGVGASKVCEHTRRQLGEEYTLVNVGDVMLQEALEHGLATSRKELVRLRLRDQRALQRRAGEHIARESDSGPILINTHLVVETPLGYIPGLGTEMLGDIDPGAFVIVDADTETIRDRRERSDRSYAYFSQSVEFHKQLQNSAALAYSLNSSAPIYHLRNEGEIEETSEQLATIAGILSNLSTQP
ncbi:MAG: AAA family ATPase [Halovenus sp.]|uniref:AAA family ATPase n=1 Tax=Halovenus amylolytica TaxID=2500550 RepID=UPI000FE3E8B3